MVLKEHEIIVKDQRTSTQTERQSLIQLNVRTSSDIYKGFKALNQCCHHYKNLVELKGRGNLSLCIEKPSAWEASEVGLSNIKV